MEQYSLWCLDCDEIFPGREHTCKEKFTTPITVKVRGVNKDATRLDESTIQYSKSSSVEDGTQYQSLLENSTKIISTTKEDPSDQIGKDKEPTCQTSMQQNAAFSCSSGAPSVQQRSGDSGEGSSLYEPELEKYNLSERPIFQEDGHKHFTSRDVANSQSMSADHSVRNAISSTSPSNIDASAGPSNGWRSTDPPETFDAETYRREVDRHFECPFCTKSFRFKSRFLDHYRTHTGDKPYSCDTCEYKCTTKGNLERHRRTHTGEKAYKCPFCEKSFTISTYCKKHIKSVHHKK